MHHDGPIPKRIVCISDLHGRLPDVPECDVLAIAGDVCPHAPGANVGGREDLFHQSKWLAGPFREWLERIPARHVVGCWGNHDFIARRAPDRVPTSLRWTPLTDAAATIDGIRFYGTPWQLWFYDWAFNAPYGKEEGESFLAEKWSAIPEGTDILLVHGPPEGYGDLTAAGKRSGSSTLTGRIRQFRPKLVVTGHIHEAYGRYDLDGVPVINASVVNLNYALAHEPVVLDIQIERPGRADVV